MKFFSFKKKEESATAVTQHMIDARAHGLMALWAAEKMGKSCEEAANYADRIIEEDKGDSDFITEINADLIAAEQHVDMEDLQERLDGFKVVAKLEFEDEEKLGGGCE